MQKLRYFRPSEFKMGSVNVFDKMQPEFLAKLDQLRESCGVPLVITSSYRSVSYNKRIGGASNSMHIRGRAVDVVCKDSGTRAKIMRSALDLGLTVGVMRYALHIDNRLEQIVFHYYPRYSKR